MRSALTLSATSLLVAGLFAASPALAQSQAVKTVPTSAGPVEVSRFADGLERPWGIDFLPDGRALVTEKPGRLRIMARDGSLSPPLAGTPKVFNQGQGGLMDVAADPDFARNRTVYLAYAEPGENGTARTALGRGTLGESGIEDFQVIFRQSPKVDGGNHFGTRIAFAHDGHIFLTLGERFKFDPAQKRDNTLGKVVRLNRDGSLPKDNPFAGEGRTGGAIWSYGHRNIEAAAIDPRSGALWIGEMGPLGGDELNRPEAGRNYGWPVVSWGKHYDGRDIPDPPTRKEFADAAVHWTPVISPSGMVFYTGGLFRDWQGSALLGGLSAKGLVRVAIDGSSAKEVERIPLDARIRDVAQGPDDALYVITDAADGAVLRLAPAK
ncbi:PQQ-dependent sugar dehydrogenase (plasmid) [Azospirillum oryzae]|uniref:PQQ-dependent sugar dehydrogenase n=1 Tax=Azospirillum oryzae TaxID=286727 RepID=A0A6N1AR46_9PROT|nr:PQQ-dependent sugar dehydrogenase [Azospirillum oryzae]KAA0587721.1 PQQ-dependent sugar dehydrogenase [Azospirillum oryzae]QKS53833.1 PQQ-dependent sugar dehydrogenase [Azospirillum oryzae]GLR81458.1 dehydrogenase [Azospirillum oryzae]